MKDHVSDLEWWMTAILLVLEDVQAEPADIESFKESYRLLIPVHDRLALLAQVGKHYDAWLEVCHHSGSGVRLLQHSERLSLNAQKDLSPDQMSLLTASKRLTYIIDGDLGAAADRVQAVRTVLYGLKKWRLNEPLSVAQTSRKTRALAQWSSNQGEIRDSEARRKIFGTTRPEALRELLVQARYLLTSVLANFEAELSRAMPRPGPGGVKEGYSTLYKWDALTCLGPFSLAQSWRLTGINENPELPTDRLWDYTPLEYSKLTAVPKDWNKFRLITVEPNTNQFWQQAVREAILQCMRRHGYTKHIDLSDQGKQGILATLGSLWEASDSAGTAGNLPATLDFSDASDLVSWDLVKEIFPAKVVRILAITRSFGYVMRIDGSKSKVLLPTYSYAGMGNATTFAIETLVFWAICTAKLCIMSPQRGYKKCSAEVFVYGDDVIIPTWLCQLSSLFEDFKLLGWRLNTDKSYFAWEGGFRESCGFHMWLGKDVTPTRFKGYRRKGDPSETAPDMLALADKLQAIAISHPTLATVLYAETGFPNYEERIAGSNCVSIAYLPNNPPPMRWNKNYQYWEVQVIVGVSDTHTVHKATCGLLRASLLGFSYCVWRRISRKRGKVRVHITRLLYNADVPRRLHLEKAWRPAKPWGRPDVDEVLKSTKPIA